MAPVSRCLPSGRLACRPRAGPRGSRIPGHTRGGRASPGGAATRAGSTPSSDLCAKQCYPSLLGAFVPSPRLESTSRILPDPEAADLLVVVARPRRGPHDVLTLRREPPHRRAARPANQISRSAAAPTRRGTPARRGFESIRHQWLAQPTIWSRGSFFYILLLFFYFLPLFFSFFHEALRPSHPNRPDCAVVASLNLIGFRISQISINLREGRTASEIAGAASPMGGIAASCWDSKGSGQAGGDASREGGR